MQQRSRPRGSRGEDGVVAIAVAMLALVLLATAFGLVRIGRLRLERRQLQQAADSVALAAGLLLRDAGRGPTGQLEQLAALAAHLVHGITGRNDVQLSPLAIASQRDESGREAAELLTVQLSASAEPVVPGGAPVQLVGRATVRLGRELTPAGPEGWPAVVYVVEATNSLYQKIEGTERSFWEILYQAFQQSRFEQLPLALGMVAFAWSELQPSVEPRLQNHGALRAKLEEIDRIARIRREPKPTLEFITTYLKASGRNTDLGLKRAAELLAVPEHAKRSRSVVLVTTGPPLTDERGIIDKAVQIFRSSSDATADRARALRGAASSPGAALYSVEMTTEKYATEVLDAWIWRGVKWLQGREVSNFLLDVAGAAGSAGGDRAYYYVLNLVDTVDRLAERLRTGACTFRLGADRDATALAQGPGALSAAARVGQLGVFVVGDEGGAAEQRLERVSEATISTLADANRQGYALQNVSGWPELRLALGTCLELGRDPHKRLLVRWGEPVLALPQGAPN